MDASTRARQKALELCLRSLKGASKSSSLRLFTTSLKHSLGTRPQAWLSALLKDTNGVMVESANGW